MTRRLVGVMASVGLLVGTVIGVTTSPAGAGQVTVPMTCTFVGTNPPVIVHQENLVTVVAPSDVQVGDTFDVTFRLEVPEFSPTPYDIGNLSLTTTYAANGPVAPSGSFEFHQGPDDYPKGSTVMFETFTKSFTATAAGTIKFLFQRFDYQFALAHGDCYADIPSILAPSVLITSTQVAAAATATTAATTATPPSTVAQRAVTVTPTFTG